MSNAECRGLVGYLSLPVLYVSLIGIGLVLFSRPMSAPEIGLYAASGYIYSQLWLLALAWPLFSIVCQTADGSSVCSVRAYRAWLGSIGLFLVAHSVVESQLTDFGWRPWQMQAVAVAAVVCEFMWPGPYSPSDAAVEGKRAPA